MLNEKTLKTLVKVVVVLLVVMLLVPSVVLADNGGGGGGGGGGGTTDQVIDIVMKVFTALFGFTGAALLVEGLYTWIQAHANEDSHGMNIGRRSITIGVILLAIAGATTINTLTGLAKDFFKFNGK